MLNMEDIMYQLKQIGPRIREQVYDALHNYSAMTRLSMSKIVEDAVKEYLEKKGFEVADDHRN